MPSMAAERDLLAARYAVPDNLKHITSLAEKYKGLMPSMAAERDLLAARYAVPDNLKHITSLAEKYKGLMPSMAAERDLLAARYAVPDNLKHITSLAEKYKGLMPSMAAERDLLATRYAVPDNLKHITSLAEKYKGLMPASIRALGFSFDAGISNQSTLKALYNSVNNYLENISASDLNSIIKVAKEYSSTSEGAAYIATTATEINSIEPDAITKLEEVKNKNGLIRKFRELPLPLQLIVYFLIAHVFVPIIEDALKAETLELYTKASSVIIKSLPANSYIKELVSSNKEKTDFEMLKQLRIITAHNVNLREKPSMKGEVIVFLNKYDVVSVLDKGNRKWLYVQVLIDGEYVNGWVNRTYTKNLNKI